MANRNATQVGTDTFIIRDRLKGAFSTQKVSKVGTGTTTRKTIKKTYYYVEEEDNGSFMIQELSDEFVPMGRSWTVSRDEFLATYRPEVEMYSTKVEPALKTLGKRLARGDRYLRTNQNFSAEIEYQQALGVDENNVRATFGLGFVYLRRGEKDKAMDVFGRIVELEGSFYPEHKHMFNEFGIELRKNKMFDQAVAYYKRAVELASDDENLFFNIARAYYEGGDWRRCVAYLITCLELNRGVGEAQKFVRHLFKKGEDGSAAEQFGSSLSQTQLRSSTSSLMTDLRKASGMSEKEARAIQIRVQAKLAKAKALKNSEIHRTLGIEKRNGKFKLSL